MQETYNEIVEQRNTAIRIQNKMLALMKDSEDMQTIGPIIKEQQKIINDCVEKKLTLSKLQASIWEKSQGEKEDFTLGDLDEDLMESLITKDVTPIEPEQKEVSKKVIDILEFDQEKLMNDLWSAKEQEFDKYKYVESEKAGMDLGEGAIDDWFAKFNEEFSNNFIKNWLETNAKAKEQTVSEDKPEIVTPMDTKSYVNNQENRTDDSCCERTIDILIDTYMESLETNLYLKNMNDLLRDGNLINREGNEDASRSRRAQSRKKEKSSLNMSGFKGMFGGGIVDLISGVIIGGWKLAWSIIWKGFTTGASLLFKWLGKGLRWVWNESFAFVGKMFTKSRVALNNFGKYLGEVLEKPLSNIKTFFAKGWQFVETAFPRLAKFFEPVAKLMPKLAPILGKFAGLLGAFLLGWDIGKLIDKLIHKLLPNFAIIMDNAFLKSGMFFSKILSKLPVVGKFFSDMLENQTQDYTYNKRMQYVNSAKEIYAQDLDVGNDADKIKKNEKFTKIETSFENLFGQLNSESKSTDKGVLDQANIIKTTAKSLGKDDNKALIEYLKGQVNVPKDEDNKIQKTMVKVLEDILKALDPKYRPQNNNNASSGKASTVP
jgi:hypothetical protein